MFYSTSPRNRQTERTIAEQANEKPAILFKRVSDPLYTQPPCNSGSPDASDCLNRPIAGDLINEFPKSAVAEISRRTWVGGVAVVRSGACPRYERQSRSGEIRGGADCPIRTILRPMAVHEPISSSRARV
jgi:hypothetical protein